MKNKYAFVVGASENYAPGLIALCNSISKFHDNVDIRLLDYNLSEDTISKLEKINITLHIQKATNQNQILATAIERFEYAYFLGQYYDAVCLMDADLFLTANCDTFFDVASKGFIVTGSNGMLINFNEDHQKKYNVDLNCKDYFHTKVHTTVPIFINEDNLDWFKLLYDSKRIDHFDDFLYLNILGIKLDKSKKMITMPPYCFTGIHHFNLKPVTGIIRKENIILAGTEEQAYMIHGKWWDKGWYSDLMLVMEKYFKDNHFSDLQREWALRSRKIMLQEFSYYLNI